MSDRELLEKAAKAGGYPIHSDGWAVAAGGGTPSLYMGNNGPKWNPLTDDGDALRLAVKLRLSIAHTGGTADVEVGKGIISESRLGDPYAATRRAIVRAAAAIGEKL